MRYSKFKHKCPKCKKLLCYKNKYTLKVAFNNNSMCRSCISKSLRHSNKTKKKISKALIGHKVSKLTIKRIKRSLIKNNYKGKNSYWFGKHHSKKTKLKLSKFFKGHKLTEETKTKVRLAKIKWIKENIFKGKQIYPTYNKEAHKLINKYGREHGYKFKHAMNGGEYLIKGLGYWVDGYDKKNNVVIEVDERHHYINGKLRKKDKIRQKEITKFLKCKFIRIKI